LVIGGFGWKVTLLCFDKFFFMLGWFLRLLKGDRESVLEIFEGLKFKVSHILWEGNHYVEKLASL